MRANPGLSARMLVAAAFSAALSGCAVGPDYARPELELPKGIAASQSPVPAPERWWSVFNDPVLDRLVDEALTANRDLRVAASRIEQARAQAAITRSDQLPSVGIEASRSKDRSSALGRFPPPPDALETNTHRAVVRFAWELDFWGKYRRASEAARADLLAAEAGRDAVRASLIADVARAHFAIEAIDLRRAVALRTLEGWRIALDLIKRRLDAGVISELDYHLFAAQVRAAEAVVPAIERERTRQEGLLAVLLGRTPRAVFEASIERGLASMPEAVEVPAGMPSDLLRRRPDLRQAEAQLMAANARIGVATAAYYPSISLTGFFGGESQALADLFTGPARTWSIAAGLLQPIYGGGQIRGGVDLADARTREAAARYDALVANAFREVRDAIADQSTAREVLAAKRAREESLARALELARLRYGEGLTGLLELLEAERQLLDVRLERIDADRDRRNAVVDLFLATGS
jgi:outer membrane protein, multidrug efflux system